MTRKVRQRWKVLPDFPRYEINQYGDVRYVETKARLPRTEYFSGKQWYQLQDTENVVRLKSMWDLVSTVHDFSF